MVGNSGFHRFTVIAGIVAWSGVLLQLYLSLQLSLANGKTVVEGLVIFFGYFTILTNILVALVLTLPGIAPASPAGRFLARPGVGTATAAAIALVGIAYHLLLRTIWDPQGWQLVADVVLHYVTPVLYLFHWWGAVPKRELRLRHIGVWTGYPVAYLVYLLIRGEVTGLYPYPFLDLPALGWGRTMANALAVQAGFLIICLVLFAAGRLQGRSGTVP